MMKLSVLAHVMSSQAPSIFKCFAAIIAKESLLLNMGFCVAVQITCRNKTFGALATLVWLFSSMCTPRVNGQIAGCAA